MDVSHETWRLAKWAGAVLALAILFLSLTACGDDERDPYTWGDVAAEISLDYCEGLEHCGWYFSHDDGVAICAEHTTFHLCTSDRSCEWGVDEGSAREALDACDAALDAMDPDGDACFWMKSYGIIPLECHAVVQIKPDAPDAGPE